MRLRVVPLFLMLLAPGQSSSCTVQTQMVTFQGDATSKPALPGGSGYTYSISTAPTQGTASFASGTNILRYATANPNFVGVDAFTYQATLTSTGEVWSYNVSVDVIPSSCQGLTAARDQVDVRTSTCELKKPT